MKTWQRMPGYWFDSRRYYFTKTKGRAYAALATLSNVTGSLLWRARLLIQHKDNDDPPKFLRDLIGHSVRAVFTAKPQPELSTRPASKREGV
jgi:hypothetical protein